MDLLKENSDFVVCVKEAGLLSEGEGKNSLVTLLKEQTGSEIYPVHRLDKETAGVMVYAKNSKTAATFSKQITENKIKKRYYAIIKGCPEEKEGVFEDLLFRDKQKNKTYTVKRMRKGVRDAKLEYSVLKVNNGLSLVDILLHTGRTHQIRVQFSSRNMPLYGDGKYGGGSGKLALFAYSLSFINPITNERETYTSLPNLNEEPWNRFN